MNAADLARLELAKRAYQATAPSDAEVQTAVRRARLALTRPKRRRNWFSRGLVFVVLAIGSLAYAKPHAIAELVEQVLPREDSAKHAARGGAVSAPVDAVTQSGGALRAPGKAAGANADANTKAFANTSESANTNASANTNVEANANALQISPQPLAPAATETHGADAPKKAGKVPQAAQSPLASNANPARGSTTATEPRPNTSDTHAVTDWGRVGQALARGDDTEALSALNQLSASDDQRTRDKADMGRAQLLVAHGDSAGCALARSLTHRRAGGRIERQAQLLLKNCGR